MQKYDSLRGSILFVVVGFSLFAAPCTVARAQDIDSNSLDNQESLPSDEGEALRWLFSRSDDAHLQLGGATNIFRSSYFPASEVTAKRLGALESDPGMPAVVQVPTDTVKRLPIEVLTFQSEGPLPVRCQALLQVVYNTHVEADLAERQRQVEYVRNAIPFHPLDNNCRPLVPWSPLPYPQHPLVGSGHKVALYQQGEFIEIDYELNCAGYVRVSNNSIAISARTKFVINGRINAFETQYPAGRYVLPQTISGFKYGFDEALKEAGLPKLQFLANDYISDHPDVVEVDFSIIDDAELNTLCLATTFSVGDVSWSKVQELPREGRTAPWSPRSESNKTEWQTVRDAREFGYQVGTALLNR